MLYLKRLMHCQGGNFGIMTAILLPVLLGSAGLAIDFGAALTTKTSAQGAADAASLAAAAALAETKITNRKQAEDFATKFVKGHLAHDANLFGTTYDAKSVVTETVNPKTAAKEFSVQVELNLAYATLGLSKVVGHDEIKIGVKSVTRSSIQSQKSLSMYLVLDKSGSMKTSTTELKSQSPCWYYTDHDSRTWRAPCYFSQIEALKNASAALFDKLDEVDPKDMYIRVGSIAYDSSPKAPSPLEWGSENSRAYVSALEADGNTSSTEAFRRALNEIKDAMEVTKHINRNNVEPERYILFMTDGANNNQSDDIATKKLCKQAEDAGITVFGVAFNAPAKGKDLLRVCASNGKYYYDAKDADSLIKAFQDIGKKAVGDDPRLTM